jgi:hypothetical protein
MKKIKPNSIEAVFYFASYICMQDGKFSSEEKEQLFLDMAIVKKLYLDLYGELIHDDLKLMCNNFFIDNEIDESFIGTDLNDTEISYINSIINDPSLRDIAMMVARNAAAADGLQLKEQSKYQYWYDYWIK